MNFAHSTGPGTPFPTGTSADLPNACFICHMQAANGSANYHYFRINTSASYYTFPTPAQFYGCTGTASNVVCNAANGQTAPNVSPDGSYANAAWLDVDIACGQCHGGGTPQNGNNISPNPYGIKSNGAPYFSRAYLANVAANMHCQTTGTAPAITSVASTTFTVGLTGSFSVTAAGTPTPTLGESGTLPSGVGFNASTGVLSGTPAAGSAGSYPVNFTASNGICPCATQSFPLTVDAAPVITSASSATFAVGATGSFTVTATGPPTATLSESGTLPSGVSFNAGAGVLSGTPALGTGTCERIDSPEPLSSARRLRSIAGTN